MRLLIAKTVAGALAAALAIGLAVLPYRAWAQGVPSYGRPSPAAEETIHGRIESILGPFAIVVRDDRGFLDSVALRQGTIINPRGLRLAVGMSVTIVGYNAGATFSAIEIDAPYDYDAGASAYGAYGYDDYGLASAFDLGLGLIVPPVVEVVPVAPPASPPPGARRDIERPKPGHPVRLPVDAAASPAPSAQASPAPSTQASPAPAASVPSYAVPLAGVPPPQFGGWSGPSYRGVAGPGMVGPSDRGTTPQSRAPSPESRAAAPQSRAAPPPARSEPARSEPARSEPARSEPSHETRSH